MPPLEAFGPAIAIGLILLVMGWFAWGTQRNIRIGNELLAWLQTGLPMLGRRTTLRWLGSSAVELGIVEPAAPFREATVLVVLEPRDVSVLWAFARSHGRRDFVIVRANLVRPPRFTMDVRDPRGWNVGGEPAAVGAGQADDWRAGDGPPGTITRVSPGGDEGPVRALWDQLAEVTGRVWRVTVQPVVPHLEIHFRPPPVEESSAERVVAPIAELARTFSAR